MKKTYVTPQTNVVELEIESAVLAVSPVSGGNEGFGNKGSGW